MKSHTKKLIIFTLLVSNLALAAGSGRLARTRSEEDLAAAIEESLRMEEARRKTEADADARAIRAGIDASRLHGQRAPAASAYRGVLQASRETAADEQRQRARAQAVAARPDAAVAARAEAVAGAEHWGDPVYLREHIDEIIAHKPAYNSIISTNLLLDEKTASEGAFHKGGGDLEMGYRRAKLERVIAKLEGRS